MRIIFDRARSHGNSVSVLRSVEVGRMPRKMRCPKGHELEFPDPPKQPRKRAMSDIVLVREEPIECTSCDGKFYYPSECKASP
jgi:hypothetical protein